MNSLNNILSNITIDYNDFEKVSLLASDFEEWCWYNKSYETIEITKSKKFNTIIIVHELFDRVKVTDSWEFIKDIKYLLKEYGDQSEEDLKYLLNFWKEKVKKYEV